MATEAVKLITGAGDPLFGRVAYLDVMTATMAEVPLRPGRQP
jgi:adenylyltransferase/sulfurtransferase